MEQLRVLKGWAQELERRGYTLNVTREGKPILRLGKEAKPGLLSLLGPIEVKDLKAVLSLFL
jgi:hypothetical protein